MNVENKGAPFEDRTIGEIAATLPGATAVFRRFKLDFCCGGEVLLAEAARTAGLDIAAVEAAFAGLDRQAPAASPQTTDALIDFIVTRYHETHRRELPELNRLARMVEAVHAGHAAAPVGLADLLQQMSAELESHMQKEEMILFPLLRRGGHPMIVQPIAQMRHDHDDHGSLLRRLEALTHDFTLPDGACRSWQALYAGARKLADDLVEHIHTENNMLFPRFEHRDAG